ncbi:PP2C family protein-serine/threonine phosphatase [bacterium]|nr:PP2C family protein-serine/threonine phosphatase [bacterium]
MKRLVSPLARPATLALLVSLAALLLATAVVLLGNHVAAVPAGLAAWVGGIGLAVAWLAAVRFLMLDTWFRWLWVGLTVFALVLVTFAGGVGLGFAITFSATMLVLRRYRPWRQLPDRRRALFFGAGLLALALLVLAQRLWGLGGDEGHYRFPRHLGSWALWSLVGFWVFSLMHLAFNMRLHFLRLRPKLTISGLLIGGLPLLLMVAFFLVVLYTTLGGTRAARLNNILESWRAMTAEGADFAGALFDTTFVWPDGAPTAVPGAVVIAPPAWVPGAAVGMGKVVRDDARVDRSAAGGAAVRADSTDYFVVDGTIWLLRWQGLDGDAPRVRGWQLGERPLRRLSGILKVGLDLEGTGTRSRRSGIVIDTDDDEAAAAADSGGTDAGGARFRDVTVSYRDAAPGSRLFWNKYLYFGASLLEFATVRGETIGERNIFVQLRVGWPDLTGEFFGDTSKLNVLVAVALGLFGFLWLVVVVFAVFFGVRITEGIVTGVHALHRGTRLVAGGDLDARIEIPNEDEFGDLAASFNEMTAAVRDGREIALANDRLKQELATARAIQERLLPRGEPHLRDFEVAGASIPSREIGGDYYDFLAQDGEKIGIAIGDVSGKGMPAALLMSNLQASLHGQVLHPGAVAEVVGRVNDLLVRSTDPHMFATFFYGVLDAETATFTCTNAGHNPPLVLRADGSLEELANGGLLLGMVGEQLYQQDTVSLAPGEIVVLYTDGITEAVGPSAEEDDPEAMFGEEALHEVVRRNRHLPAAAIKDAILAAVNEHTAGVAQSDDITLVVIKRQG